MIKYLLVIALISGIVFTVFKSFAASTIPSKSTTYPVSKPFSEGYLQVSPLYQLWYAEYGNPNGVPVLVLHGGPGGGCKDDDMKFFDPAFWRVILLDQRGARKSKPFGELKENTTQDLINDLELLRTKLDIKQWVLFGGSWGSMLAIAYGEAYPKQVMGFILRGIFLGRLSDTLNVWYGMQDTFPDAWQEFNDYIPKEKQGDLIKAYHQLVMNPDKNVSLPAARAFFKYDSICSFLKLAPEQLQQFLSNDILTLGVTRTFIHYSVNNFFIKENQLLDNIHKINHLPLIIVHGRYDTITRAKSAYELHQHWPSSELILVDASGHAGSEPQITMELLSAAERMKKHVKLS